MICNLENNNEKNIIYLRGLTFPQLGSITGNIRPSNHVKLFIPVAFAPIKNDFLKKKRKLKGL